MANNTDPTNNSNPGGSPPILGGPQSPRLLPVTPAGPDLNSPTTTSPTTAPSTTLPVPGNRISPTPTLTQPAQNSTSLTSQPQVTAAPVAALPMANGQVDANDDGFSSDDNTRYNSNNSSMHVTPKSKHTRFSPRKVIRTHPGAETTVLSCQLALLNALSNDIESAVDGLEGEQWKTRIAQINQVVRMLQWEAQGLYGLA